MKISSKGRYALRIMLELAIYNTGEPIRLKDISKRQQISEKYLEHIISKLNKAGMVKSSRGYKGGYILTKNPRDYTVGAILRVLEGDLSPVDLEDNGSIEIEKSLGCVTLKVWEKINNAVNQVVDGITLENLVEWELEKTEQYVI